MKILELNELKNSDHQAPFYAVIDETKKGTPDARACGCASLALLNMILVLKAAWTFTTTERPLMKCGGFKNR